MKKRQPVKESVPTWYAQLEEAILCEIRKLKAQGTVGTTWRCLMQGVRFTPPYTGTNCAYYYAQDFERACKGNKKIAAFLIGDDER